MLSWWLAASLFISCYQLGVGKNGYLLEAAVIGLIIYILLWLKDHWLTAYKLLPLSGVLSASLIITNVLYLFWDLATWLYSDQRDLLVQKYPIVVVSLIISAGVLIYADDIVRLERVKLIIGLSGVVLAGIAVFNFYFPYVYPVYYSMRLSLRTDYNMYATAVYIGGVTWISRAMNRRDVDIGHLLVQFVTYGIFVTVLVLTGSRRILIVLPLWVAAFITLLIKQIQNFTHNTLKSAAIVLGGIAIACSLSLIMVDSIHTEMKNRQEQKGSYGSAEGGGSATSYVDRIDSTVQGNFLGKRLVLWKIAFKEVTSLRGKEVVFGKGGGYSMVMYDQIGEPIDQIYPDREKRMGALSPHNMVLSDIIDGGIIKMTLLLAMLLSLLLNVMEFAGRYPVKGRLYVLVFTTIALGSFISNKFGLPYDRYFYLFTTMLLLERKILRGVDYEEPK